MSSDIRLAEVGREAPEEVAFGPGTFSRALREPSYALMVAMAIVKGRVFSWWVRIFRPRVVIGRGLRIYGTLCIRGPGTVVLGDDVHIHGTVTPWTNRATARIVVGDRTKLDGTRFSCVQSVEIGADCLIANCRILDTSFHPTARRESGSDARVLEAPVSVGNSVWISPDAGLLPGTRIGDGSVVAMAAICKGEYPADVMILGNPARVAGRIP
ncbi:MAG: acyltransferase [Gemmatimonas sp.]|jgi:acetyltransferase-like isoleucine patch superfamily enzyme|uniref:acyltransferase n=1 Tax=Gemmatimonas sp. TaxID=1962908 RepID=UPI00391F6BEB|nr:acyltransferase [Gemmatimonadota bacterium]